MSLNTMVFKGLLSQWFCIIDCTPLADLIDFECSANACRFNNSENVMLNRNRAHLLFGIALMLGFVSTAPSQGVKDLSKDKSYLLAVDLQSKAQTLFAQQKYVEAESLAREANRLFEGIPGVASPFHPWHIFLGKILLKLNKNEEAYYEVASGWHPGWNERQDLLVGIAGSRCNLRNRNISPGVVLADYTEDRKKIVELRLGCKVEELPSFNRNVSMSGALLALLYGDDPSIAPEEALTWFQDAEASAPDLPQTAFLMGDAYLRLGQKEKAKPFLEKALRKAKGQLRVMVEDALKEDSPNAKLLARAERYLSEAKALRNTEEYYQTSSIKVCRHAIQLIEKAGADATKAKALLADIELNGKLKRAN